MSTIGSVPLNVSNLLRAASERSQTEHQIAFAIAGKQQQAMKQAGEAVVQMLQQNVALQTQLTRGSLDVRA